jgi:hypothetical protein
VPHTSSLRRHRIARPFKESMSRNVGCCGQGEASPKRPNRPTLHSSARRAHMHSRNGCPRSRVVAYLTCGKRCGAFSGQTRSYSEIAKFLGAPRAVQADFRLTREKFGALCKLSRQFDDICLHASVCLAFTSVLMRQRGVSETSTRGTGLLAFADKLLCGRTLSIPSHCSRLFKVRRSTRELQADNRRLPPELVC